MRKVDFEQGSTEWLQWRKGLITATDASCITGDNPFMTVHRCWQHKLGLIPDKVCTEAMARGRRDEPVARALFIQEYGINMEPCCVESEKYSYIGASLDGLSNCGRFLLEVKSQRPVSEIPLYHKIQMFHQMLANDDLIEKGYYVSHWQGQNTTFELNLDLEWMREYLPKAKEFWRCIVFEEAPPLSRNDYRSMEGNENWKNYARDYQSVCSQIKHLEDLKEKYRQKIIETCDEENCMGGGIRVLKKTSKGRIDYESIPELKIIDLERYRKKSNYSWTITLDQN